MNLKRIILLILFFAVLCTSLYQQNIYALVLFSFSTYLLLPFKKWWDRSSIALFVFSFFYVIMVVLGGRVISGFLTISYLVTPVAFYRFGQYLIVQYQHEKDRFRLLLLICWAYLINVFILTFVDISIVGIVNEERTLLGTSFDDDSLAATIYGLMASVGIGCVGACFAKVTKPIKLFFILLVGFSMLTVIHLVNRGGIVLLIFCLLASVFLYYRKRRVQFLLMTLLLVLIGFYVVNSGLLGEDILNAYEQRSDVKGYGTMTAGGRTELWSMSVKNMFLSPWGWTQDSYAHNLWLDLAKIGGWMSLVPFLFATFFTIKNIMRIIKRSRNSFSITIAILNCELFLAASIEPVIEASMLFFALLMLIWGMTDAIWRQEHRPSLG